jgi:hypothetical protein
VKEVLDGEVGRMMAVDGGITGIVSQCCSGERRRDAMRSWVFTIYASLFGLVWFGVASSYRALFFVYGMTYQNT